ncbi:MAG: hypothetical protein WDW36_004212 [Sanguina aurantia]
MTSCILALLVVVATSGVSAQDGATIASSPKPPASNFTVTGPTKPMASVPPPYPNVYPPTYAPSPMPGSPMIRQSPQPAPSPAPSPPPSPMPAPTPSPAPSPTPLPPNIISGQAIDGYLSGCVVYAVLPPSYGQVSNTTSFENGWVLQLPSSFKSAAVRLVPQRANATIFSTQRATVSPTSELCHDGASLLTQLIYLSTPAGASVITPLTTLLETTPLLTPASLAAALGFDASVDLLTYDSLYQAFVMLDPRALGVIQAEQQVASFVVQAVSALAAPDADVGTASASVFQALGALLAPKKASNRRLLGSGSFDLSALANIQALLTAIVSDNTIAFKAGVASNTQLAAVISYMQGLIVAAVASGQAAKIMATASIAQTQAALFLSSSDGSANTNAFLNQLSQASANAVLPGTLLQANVAASAGLDPSGSSLAPAPPPPSQQHYGLSRNVIIPLAVILPTAGVIAFAILLAVCLTRRKRLAAKKWAISGGGGGGAEGGGAQQQQMQMQTNAAGAVMPLASSPTPAPASPGVAGVAQTGVTQPEAAQVAVHVESNNRPL